MTQIRLRGAPEVVLVDEQAIGQSDQVQRLLAASGLEVVHVRAHRITLTVRSVAVFGADHDLIDGCHAWYVGPGPSPSWMHQTNGCGPATSAQVLALVGTALAQERAALAFRAAGAGQPAPDEVEFDPEVMVGIARAVAPIAVARDAPALVAVDVPALLHRSFAAIEACCRPNGAIAAAPRSAADEPDYWFCWQRDAAAAALALHGLARAGPLDLRAPAAARLDRYLDYVDRLGRSHDVGASRSTMDGVPVTGYGDPQHDGPAATLLAVLTADPLALETVRPYVKHLLLGEQVGYDLWELIRGRSFHAANLRRRALRLVARLATDTDDDLASRCQVPDERKAFAAATGGYLHVLGPEPTWFGAIRRLDVSVLGSALLGYEPGDLDDPRIASTVEQLEDHYAHRWPVNAAWRAAGHLGAGIGRFPEDGNDGFSTTGGNPWPIATLWLAQYHLHRGERERAAGYLDFVLAHSRDSVMSEQIDSETGDPRGPRGLTWAHAELITTLLIWDQTH